MMYPFITLDDATEIVHSEMKDDGRMKVYTLDRQPIKVTSLPFCGICFRLGSPSSVAG